MSNHIYLSTNALAKAMASTTNPSVKSDLAFLIGRPMDPGQLIDLHHTVQHASPTTPADREFKHLLLAVLRQALPAAHRMEARLVYEAEAKRNHTRLIDRVHGNVPQDWLARV